MKYLLAIDLGTTNSRAIIFNETGEVISQHNQTIIQFFPEVGWVEQDPHEILQKTIWSCREALKKSNLEPKNISAIGIANQRETTILWDKVSGEAVYPAISWQDRRTHDLCDNLAKDNKIQQIIHEKTGLLLDPYFSATKILWILENVPGVREKANGSQLLFGTIDTYLLWHLTREHVHLTDASNASRTSLFNIHTQKWDETLLDIFNIPMSLLPKVVDNSFYFGELNETILGERIPITGMVGDQQGALIGQACLKPGMIKATFGTGCFLVLNTGNKIQESKHVINTVAYRIDNQVTYATEGTIFSAGNSVKWLRDNIHLIQSSDETEVLAKSVKNNNGVYIIPAFTGLGAPYWNTHVKGAILGLTASTQKGHIVRAALESVVYQVCDLLHLMGGKQKLEVIRVDGGMTANGWLMQFLADILRIEVDCHPTIETTALGAAYLAGLKAGIYSSLDEVDSHFPNKIKYLPKMNEAERDALYEGWQKAMKTIMGESQRE